MNIKKISFLSLVLLGVSHGVIAEPIGFPSLTLNAERENVIHRYVNDLEKANYQDIAGLFAEGGIVVSTSRGNVNAKEFFYAFLPSVESAITEFHQAFTNLNERDRYAARFHLSFKLKDGEASDGEYMDEFVFAKNSVKLTSVYMFENLKFSVKA